MNEIKLKDISFTYAEEKNIALSVPSLSINQGEIIFVTGKSGSGKSSLLNIINGVIPEVIEGDLKGEIIFNNNKSTDITSRNENIANVFQNPRSQFFTNDSTAELVFEMENLGYSKEEMLEKLEYIVKKYNIAHLLDKDIQSLSSGERQFLALVSAMVTNPQFVLFDEPSSNLDYGNAMRLKQEILKLKAENKTVIISDHRCFYLDGIIDRVFLIEDKTITQYKSQKDFEASQYPYRNFQIFNCHYTQKQINKSNDTVFEVNNLHFKDILKDVSFKLNKGEICFLCGVNGSGKTTIARLMADYKNYSKLGINSSKKCLYIMQDADYQLFGSSVFNELNLNCDSQAEIENALNKVDLLHLQNKHPHELSGGEKQRLQIAISLITNFELIVFDEPTSGLDCENMNRVIEHIEKLKEKAAILIISHDYEFIRKTADRVLYLKNGIIEKDFYMDDTNILNNIFKEMEKHYEQKI